MRQIQKFKKIDHFYVLDLTIENVKQGILNKFRDIIDFRLNNFKSSKLLRIYLGKLRWKGWNLDGSKTGGKIELSKNSRSFGLWIIERFFKSLVVFGHWSGKKFEISKNASRKCFDPFKFHFCSYRGFIKLYLIVRFSMPELIFWLCMDIRMSFRTCYRFGEVFNGRVWYLDGFFRTASYGKQVISSGERTERSGRRSDEQWTVQETELLFRHFFGGIRIRQRWLKILWTAITDRLPLQAPGRSAWFIRWFLFGCKSDFFFVCADCRVCLETANKPHPVKDFFFNLQKKRVWRVGKLSGWTGIGSIAVNGNWRGF